MRAATLFLLTAILAVPAAAQAVPAPPAASPPQRLVGTISAFVAPQLTVITAKGETIAVALTPDAKVIAGQHSSFNAIKANDFVSLTAATDKDGKLKAKEVRVFPQAMRGFGEGQYPGDKAVETRINGAVSEAATIVRGKGGILKIKFHAAAANALGLCSGHAPAPGVGACTGEVEVAVSPSVPVTVWVLGDPSWLEAGKAVSLYAVAGSDGKPSTYGVIVERSGVKPSP